MLECGCGIYSLNVELEGVHIVIKVMILLETRTLITTRFDLSLTFLMLVPRLNRFNKCAVKTIIQYTLVMALRAKCIKTPKNVFSAKNILFVLLHFCWVIVYLAASLMSKTVDFSFFHCVKLKQTVLLPPSFPPVDDHNIWSLPQKSLKTSPTCFFFLKQCSVVPTFTISNKMLHTYLVRIRVEFVRF